MNVRGSFLVFYCGVSLNALPSRAETVFIPPQYPDSSNYVASSLIQGEVLHWALSHPQIRVYIAPSQPGNTQAVLAALSRWNRLLDGTLHFVETSQKDLADIEIEWSETPLPSQTAEFANALCEKTIRAERDIVHARIRLNQQNPYTHRPFSSQQTEALALHEIGHALGLNHSLEPQDVMYPGLTANPPLQPSQRDIRTLRLIYHYAAQPGWQGPPLTTSRNLMSDR